MNETSTKMRLRQMLELRLISLWAANTTLVVVYLVMCTVVDLNGRVFGMSEGGSFLLFALIVGVGLIVDALTFWIDRRMRLVAIGVACIYLLMMEPVVI